MNFKGTKGKWVLNYSQGSWLIQDSETYQEGFKSSIAEVYYFDDGKNTAEYNALLISKAPEMLDFINRISGEMLRNDFILDEKWYEQARQLIKESTEL